MLPVKIVQEWIQTLTDPFDWGEWPLGRYLFGEAFHRHLDNPQSLDNIAWVCAMVACGLAHESPKLKLHPRPVDMAVDGHLVRGDDTELYRCTILSGLGRGSRLDFCRLPSGVLEFETFTPAICLVSSAPEPN